MKKIILSAVFAISLAFAVEASAQEQTVKLSGGSGVSLKEIFDQIESQTDFSVDYLTTVVDVNRKVNVKKGAVRLDDLLDSVLPALGYSFEFNKSHIIVSQKSETAEPQKQNASVSGVVTDDLGEPLPGASINVKGTDKWTVTDAQGKYIVEASIGDVLLVSFIGYQPAEVKLSSATADVKLVSDVNFLDEVVVVGYGSVFKKKTTSSIAIVSAEEIASVPVPNITQTLAGRAPGLFVQQSGGGLDAKAAISIRGGGTPLYVIDNVICDQQEFQNINPSDISSMSILKDASATAIYGARAANGIVIVTTKQGESGRLSVDYDFHYGISQPAHLASKVDSYTAASYVNRGLQYDGGTPSYSEADLELFKNHTDPKGHPDTDWQSICMRRFAPEQRHTLSVSGGTDKVRVYTGLAYNNQESIYKSDSHDMQRFNFRTNVEASFNKIGLKITSSVDAYLSNSREPATANGSGYYYVWSHIQNKRPMEVAVNPMGQIYSGTTDNPLLDISGDGGYVSEKSRNLRVSVAPEWSVPWVSGLKLRAVGSYSVSDDHVKQWLKTAPAYDWDGNVATAGQPSLTKSVSTVESFNTQFLVDYSREFGKHSLSATAGIEASGASYDNLSASRKNYIFDVDQMGAGPSSTMENSSPEGISEHRAAVLGRIRYDYMSKYLVEFNTRYDGSDYFPADKRWGLFFSGSAAWTVSEENFWKNGVMGKILETLKLRASYGEIGQDDVERYSYLTSYSLSQRGAYLGGEWVPVFREGDLVSPDITWYKTKDFDAGIDFSTLSSKLSGSIDYFSKITTGYLASPSNVGYTSPLGKDLPLVKSNGESRRNGFEFIAQWRSKVGKFSYGISANLSLFDERWNINPYESETSLKNPYTTSTQVRSYSGIYYHNLGYYTSYEDVMNSPKRNSSSNLQAGDIKYEDFNGDGKINNEDMTRLGSGTKPRCNYGVNLNLGYGGWYMDMLWQGAGHYDFYMSTILQGGNSTGYLPVIYDFQTDIWSPDNTGSLYPRQHASSGYNGSNNFVSSDFWLVDAAYLRLKSLDIGYDFKKTVLKNCSWLSKMALSLSGYNLLTFSPATKYGFDPESGRGDGYTYPIARTYSINLKVGF